MGERPNAIEKHTVGKGQTNATNVTSHFIQAGNLRPFECSQWREAKKCNWCYFTSIKADDLRREVLSTI